MELYAFVSSPHFKSMLSELKGKSARAQKNFVKKVVLNKKQLDARGIVIPKGVMMQTSEFEALGPDLFVVRKYVRPGINANITFFPNTLN